MLILIFMGIFFFERLDGILEILDWYLWYLKKEI